MSYKPRSLFRIIEEVNTQPPNYRVEPKTVVK